jgi:serine/threonine protein kinase/tetratricopeptide (TPR) repeat protein
MTPAALASQCPPLAALEALLADQSPEPRAGDVVNHVEHCSACQQRLQSLLRESSLLTPADRLPSNPPQGELEFLQGLAQRFPGAPRPVSPSDRKAPPTPLPEIPGFQRLELRGRGGAGEVYRAWQPALARWVALKTLSALRSAEFSERVAREAQILGRLSHPHIVQIYDTGAVHGQPYLVMEWIGGGSLQDRIRGGRLSIGQVARLGLQLATALEAVHALGIVHRDLKPANVLLREPRTQPAVAPGRETSAATHSVTAPANAASANAASAAAATAEDPLFAKLTDFSISLDPGATDRLTLTGQVVGTPLYMAPEQTGLAPHLPAVGPATDLYGLGATLYAALTGRAPHGSGRGLALLREVATEEPRSPRVLRPDLPRDLETILVKCLRHDPAERYRSAAEVAADLGRFLAGEPIAARPRRIAGRLWSAARRRPRLSALAALAVVLATLAGGGVGPDGQQLRLLEGEMLPSQQRSVSNLASAAWDTLQQLNQRTEQLLRSGKLQADDSRLVVETLRAQYRTQVDSLDASDLAMAWQLALGFERLVALEEREGALEEALEDLARLERVAGLLPEGREQGDLLLRRDRQQLSVLLQLKRFDEAGERLDGRLDRHASGDPGSNLLDTLRSVSYWTHFCLREQLSESCLPRLNRALDFAQRHLERHPEDLEIWRGRFELLAQKLELLKTNALPQASEDAQQDWLRIAREFFSLERPARLDERIARLRFLERIVELTGSVAPRGVPSLLAHWMRQIAEFSADQLEPVAGTQENDPSAVSYQSERVYQQLACLTQRLRVASGTDQAPADVIPGWSDCLRAAHQYLVSHPGDLDTRLRLGWVLVNHSRLQLTVDPEQSLQAAREASDLMAPVSEAESRNQEGQKLLADAQYITGAALRQLGRLSESREHLERAYLSGGGTNRDTIAADLVVVNLELGDRVEAERCAGWLLKDGPHLQAVRRLLGQGTAANARE